MQAVIIVLLSGFFVLGFLAYRTYTDEPPIPSRVQEPDSHVLFSHDDILSGQGTFLRNGLMEYGSIFGHGAYLGPDYTADYLHRAVLLVRQHYAGQGSDRSAAQAVADFKTNRYDPTSGVLTFTDAQAAAFNELTNYYSRIFSEPSSKYGLRPQAIADPNDARQLTAFFAWSAWAAAALRPGKSFSYTNNWPPESLVNNGPTADMLVWSVLSLIALLGGIGLMLVAFGRWNFLGWHGRERQVISFHSPDRVALTPAQRACAWFFFVMAVLFLLQTVVGGATQHYCADISSFTTSRCSTTRS